MNRKSELASAVATLKAKANGGVPRVGQVGLTDKTLYLNVSCKGQGGTIQLVDVNTKREVGITNIDGNKLNAGRDYVLDSFRVLKGKGTANLKEEIWGITDPLHGVIQNAEVRIKQGGNVLVDMPIKDLYNQSTEEHFRSLSTSPLIRSNMEFEFEIEYPKGVAVPTDAEYNLRFEFRVHQAKR